MITGRGNDIIVDSGLLSPCATDHPEVALRAKRLEYNPASGRTHVHGASLDFYGLRLPLLPVWTTRLGGSQDSGPTLLPTVGYARRDGFFLPYSFDLSPHRPAQVDTLEFRLTQKRGITFLSQNKRVLSPRWTAELWGTRMENVRGKMAANLVYDRLPELLLTGYQMDAHQNQGWKLGTSLGYFNERDQTTGGEPPVHRERALLGVGYNWGGHAQAKRRGQWASLWSTGAVYSGGEHYLDTTATVGWGRRLSPSLAARPGVHPPLPERREPLPVRPRGSRPRGPAPAGRAAHPVLGLSQPSVATTRNGGSCATTAWS